MKQSVFYPDLLEQADSTYRDFTHKLIPTLPIEHLLGIRMPDLRKLAKRLYREERERVEAFLADLPHDYYDENNLHALFLSEQKEWSQLLPALDSFLPHINNWATCDLLRPAALSTYKSLLLPHIKRWMADSQEYTVRFGLEMLMIHFLDGQFQPEFLQWAVEVQHEAYYVRMMQAWFFATSLTKQYEATLPIFINKKLPPWIHNKSIQKARESRLIPDEHKGFLASLKQ